MAEDLSEPVKSGDDLSTGTRRMTDLRRKTAHKTRQDEKQHAQKRKEKDRADEDHMFAAMVTSQLASAEQIAAFRAALDGYEQATIEALQENERRLAEVRAAKEAMLAQAYVLPDGRRVFRTADGSAVYDEFGREVGLEEVDPAVLPDSAPTWDTFSPVVDELDRLEQERQALLDFQEKLDAARDALDAGEITQAQLEEMQADLIASMPDAVRAQLPKDHPAVVQTAQTEADPTPETDNAKGPSLDGLQGFAPGRPGS